MNPVTSKPKIPSVVLADDHEIVREGFAAFCECEAGLSVSGQCADGVIAIRIRVGVGFILLVGIVLDVNIKSGQRISQTIPH